MSELFTMTEIESLNNSVSDFSLKENLPIRFLIELTENTIDRSTRWRDWRREKRNL